MLSELELKNKIIALKNSPDWVILSEDALFNDVWFVLFDERFDASCQLNIIDDMDISDLDFDYEDAEQSAIKYDSRKNRTSDSDCFDKDGVFMSRHISGCKPIVNKFYNDGHFATWRELRLNDDEQIIATCEIISLAEIIRQISDASDVNNNIKHYVVDNSKYAKYIDENVLKRLHHYVNYLY